MQGYFALSELNIDLINLCRGLNWPVFAAIATHGQSKHAFWVPATSKFLEAQWSTVLKKFNCVPRQRRLAEHDPVSILSQTGKMSISTAGLLLVTAPSLEMLRSVTQTALGEWSQDVQGTLPNLLVVTKTLLEALQNAYTASCAGDAKKAKDAIDVDDGQGMWCVCH